jgi:spermidine synthase
MSYRFRDHQMIIVLYVAFVLSGAAGLIYESIWTRYLGLFVGHDAYAQIIVLVIFLGGMSVGAMGISRWSERLKEPLYGYVAIEFGVGCIGLFFHDIFQGVTSWVYHGVYPALAGTWGLTAAKWAVAGGLILPQSILLGMTFPLMSAGVLRFKASRPGRTLSLLYFSNSLGASVGVLIAGFYLVELAGLPGTLLTAAMLNLLVALVTVGVIAKARGTVGFVSNRRLSNDLSGDLVARPAPKKPSRLERLLLFTSFGTAVASFIYEIDWIRMLALVLGSATHSFELMLSAFILGLALGAWWIRSRADRLSDPLRTLGLVQWTMGTLALATLPLYLFSFDWIASLLATFARTDAGYTGFTLARYGLCLIIMLPATFCAGMTLPLITQTLLKNGSGERAIGAVYGWNTLGSIIGVVLGGLILLPAIGLKPMLIVGAALDMGVGILLLSRAKPVLDRGRRIIIGSTLAVGVLIAIGASMTRLEANLLASGVYRTGILVKPGQREMKFYRDGRTATVTAAQFKATGVLSLATNGKPDASLSTDWYRACDSVTKPVALVADPATQTLVPLVTLAHMPKAQTAAIIGQGSGMSSHLLLGSPNLRQLVTIEIEPQMIAGSRVFYPANRRAFDDPRSHIVIDDAKSYFASEQRRYDLIVSEPSKPWVSGVSGLFTAEFYGRVRQYLTEDGVFGQWLHVYELDDGLVLSVLAALHQNFRSYEVYLVPSGDLLVVASNRATLPTPDWSVVRFPGLQADLCRFLPLTPSVLDNLHVAGRAELGPLLDSYGQANSDFYPVLDLGAERRRFRRDNAAGFPALSNDWFNLLASVRGRRTTPSFEPQPALPGNPRVRAGSLAAFLRSSATLDVNDPMYGQLARDAAYQWQLWQTAVSTGQAPRSWELWLEQANIIDKLRTGAAAGSADEQFYASLYRFMARYGAPEPARDVVAFRHGMATWNFGEANAAAERLLPFATQQHRWIGADELRDGLVMANLHLGNPSAARRSLDSLARFSTRSPSDLRTMLLKSYVETAERRTTSAQR